MAPDTALAVCRFLHDTSLMFLWGASAYLWILVPAKLAKEIARRLQMSLVVAAAAGVATTAASLLLETAMIGEGWSDAINSAAISDVLFGTSVGQAWQLQGAAALILIVTFGVPERVRLAATALASGLLLACVAFSGHAVIQEGWVGVAHRTNDVLHVLSGGAWLGALVPFFLILAKLSEPQDRSEAARAVVRFSTAGHVVVVVVVASGIVNTILILGRWPTEWSSRYVVMLASKIALVAVMIGLATLNRYALVPRIFGQRSNAVNAIQFGTVAEIALGLGVVGLVSVFGMLDPT